MKKVLILFAAIAMALTLTACNGEDVVEIPEEVTMENIDEFAGRGDVQYVDLRNFDDKMKSGYLEGFEFIPFFDYLEYEGILVRTDGDWTFADEDIQNEAALRGLFLEDKTIFLMCGSGTRAGYVKAALESLGYTDVLNVGGIANYDGDMMVLGDGSYNIDMPVKGDWTPGTYYGFDAVGLYLAVVTINSQGGIENVEFDALDGGTTKQVLGFDYGMVNFGGADYEWFEHANMLADYVVENQGWDGIGLVEDSIDSSWDATTVPHHFINFDAENNPDAISGVTIGAEGLVLAWNDAIAQASDSDLGVVELDADPEDWAAAHEPPFDYEDGVYYGYDDGQSALITIEGGMIVDVFLNAAHFVYGTDTLISMKRDYTDPAQYQMNYTCDDNGTPDDDTDDHSCVLDTGKLSWWGQADALEEAIIDAQEWAWTVTDGDIDGVTGVSISVGGWEAAVNEALAKAAPAS